MLMFVLVVGGRRAGRLEAGARRHWCWRSSARAWLAKVLGRDRWPTAGSGTSWRQALLTGCAMSPMSSVALLLVSQFAAASTITGPAHRRIALPAILLMEVLGAIIATFVIHRARETSPRRPARPTPAGPQDA